MPNESPTDGAPEPASPFPPAFRWETSTQEAPTQVIGAIGRDTAFRDASLDEPSESSTPPWADSDPPPIAEAQSDWLRLGPEVFQGAAPQSRSKQTIGIAVLVVVVLGLAGAAVAYFLAGGSSNRTGQITAPPATTAPRVQPVLPSAPAAAPPETAATPVLPPPAPAAPPEASGIPEPAVTPAAPPPAGFVPNPPLHRSAGGSSQGRAAVSPPHTVSRPASETPPPPPAPTSAPDGSAPDGFTIVPAKPWKPQAPQ
jgi:hypothetical protein